MYEALVMTDILSRSNNLKLKCHNDLFLTNMLIDALESCYFK